MLVPAKIITIFLLDMLIMIDVHFHESCRANKNIKVMLREVKETIVNVTAHIPCLELLSSFYP